MFLLWYTALPALMLAASPVLSMDPSYELLDPFGLPTSLPFAHGWVILRHCLQPFITDANAMLNISLTADWIQIPVLESMAVVYCLNASRPLLLPYGSVSLFPIHGFCSAPNVTCGQPNFAYQSSGRVCFEHSSNQRTRMTQCQAYMSNNDTQPVKYTNSYGANCSEQAGFSVSSDLRNATPVTLAELVLLAAGEADSMTVNVRQGLRIVCSTAVQQSSPVVDMSRVKMSMHLGQLLREHGLAQVSCTADAHLFTMSIYFFVALRTPIIKCPEPGIDGQCRAPGWSGQQAGQPTMTTNGGQLMCSVHIQVCFPRVRTLSLVGQKYCTDDIAGVNANTSQDKPRNCSVENSSSRHEKRGEHRQEDTAAASGNVKVDKSNLIIIVSSVTGGLVVLAVIAAVVVVLLLQRKSSRDNKRERAANRALFLRGMNGQTLGKDDSTGFFYASPEGSDVHDRDAVDDTMYGIPSIQHCIEPNSDQPQPTLGPLKEPVDSELVRRACLDPSEDKGPPHKYCNKKI